MTMTDIKSMTQEEITDALRAMGEPAFRGKQVTVGDILGEGVHSGIEHHSRILPFAAARHD